MPPQPPTALPVMPADAPMPVRTRAVTDAVLIVAASVLTFAVASALELAEAFNRWLYRYERWQADELPFVLLVASLGMAWYALRRLREWRLASALHDQARRQVAELLERNRQLAQQLINLQESERAALARELHDELGQRCTAIRVEAALIEGAGAAGRDETRAAAARIAGHAQALHDLVRGMLRRLRPAELDELGLIDALQSLCESWETSSGIPCILQHEGRFDDLPDAHCVAVYRIAQEGLSNVMRHAQARSARLRLRRAGDGALTLHVSDDGVGFDAARAPQGLGLLGASERAAALGGALSVEGGPGSGTVLKLALPAPPPAA